MTQFDAITRDVSIPGLPMGTVMDYVATINREVAIRRNHIIGATKRREPVKNEEHERLAKLQQLQEFINSFLHCYPSKIEIMSMNQEQKGTPAP